MSDFLYSHNTSNRPSGNIIEVLVGKSTTINYGDVLITTTNSTYTASNIGVVRPYLSGDTITTSDGITGVAMMGITTDSSADITAQTYPVTVDSASRVTYGLNSLASLLPSDPDTGYTRVPIFAFSPDNVFAALTQSNDVADYYLVGKTAGIAASAATAPADYTVNDDAAAANACLVVTGVDTMHAQFNSADGGGRVFVRGKNTFYSRENGTYFTS